MRIAEEDSHAEGAEEAEAAEGDGVRGEEEARALAPAGLALVACGFLFSRFTHHVSRITHHASELDDPLPPQLPHHLQHLQHLRRIPTPHIPPSLAFPRHGLVGLSR